MSELTVKPCRSKAADGTSSTNPRGHKSVMGGWDVVHSGGNQLWTGGVKHRAVPYKADDGHLTEADYQIWMRL